MIWKPVFGALVLTAATAASAMAQVAQSVRSEGLPLAVACTYQGGPKASTWACRYTKEPALARSAKWDIR
jgi:hypothetical protein